MADEHVTFQDAFIAKLDTIFDPNGAYPKKGEYGTIPSQALHGNKTEKRDEDHEIRPIWRQLNASEDDDDSSSKSSTDSCSRASSKGQYSFVPSPYYEERDGDDETLSFESTVVDEDDMTVETCEDNDNETDGDFKNVISQVGSGSSLIATDIVKLKLKDVVKAVMSELVQAEPVTATTKASDDGSTTSKPPPPEFFPALPVIAEDDTEQAPEMKKEKETIKEKKDECVDLPDKVEQSFFPLTSVDANDVAQDEREPITTTEVDDQEEGAVFFGCTGTVLPTDDIVEQTSVQSTVVEDARDAINNFFGNNQDDPTCEAFKPTEEEEEEKDLSKPDPEAPACRKTKRFHLGKLRKKKIFGRVKNRFRRWRTQLFAERVTVVHSAALYVP